MRRHATGTTSCSGPDSELRCRITHSQGHLRPTHLASSARAVSVLRHINIPFGQHTKGHSRGLSAWGALGATALCNNGSSLTVPEYARPPASRTLSSNHLSMFDSTTEYMPGISPYLDRMAIISNSSFAFVSVLCRPGSAQTATTVSSQEMDHIIEGGHLRCEQLARHATVDRYRTCDAVLERVHSSWA
ncbi:uncharacterized protein TRAVEDRAFT_54894 [Trametes versicolor FP-101664 SS1]|uniref:Uncharacterized protein n=1 Tax=Trametes versicolor (strain FP-101664) TaxID=717944 RepID=R7S604_TRAVS|nr:uncharacterized protein TRAVEDRAFT_54894 [Trametes versicolor FP-101664 SS1]EIW51106.1 hypothetical protein TRAVEDRAFT_54894 [Trametes versicolor FP-101664 SS1]